MSDRSHARFVVAIDMNPFPRALELYAYSKSSLKRSEAVSRPDLVSVAWTFEVDLESSTASVDLLPGFHKHIHE